MTNAHFQFASTCSTLPPVYTSIVHTAQHDAHVAEFAARRVIIHDGILEKEQGSMSDADRYISREAMANRAAEKKNEPEAEKDTDGEAAEGSHEEE